MGFRHRIVEMNFLPATFIWVGIKALILKYPYKKGAEGDFTHIEQKAVCSQR